MTTDLVQLPEAWTPKEPAPGPVPGTRRPSMSLMRVYAHCLAPLRLDYPRTKETTWAMRIGSANHDCIEVYPNTVPMEQLAIKHELTARQQEIVTAQQALLRRWAEPRFQPTWRHEVATAFDPMTLSVRVLPSRFVETNPGEWYAGLDILDIEQGWFGDWKFGGQQPVSPLQHHQARAEAPIAALLSGREEVRGTLVFISEKELSATEHTFTTNDLAQSVAEIRAIHARISPTAEPNSGAWCSYCPAKKNCKAYAAYKAESQKEKPDMTLNNVTRLPGANNKFSLASIRTGPSLEPMRLLIHGADKVGKSTFAAAAPSPIFIGLEGGLSQLGPARFPEPKTFAEVMEQLETLRVEPHSYKTLVIDPVTWLEPLIFAEVCKEKGMVDIEEVGGGYRKGYKAGLRWWNTFIRALDALRSERQMHVIVVSHTIVKNFKNATGADWGCFQPAIEGEAAERFKQWADAILFVRLEEFATEERGKVKGKSTGERIIYTTSNAAYAAGNRYGLPERLPLSWREFWSALETSRARAADLRAKIRAAAANLNPSIMEKAETYIQDAGEDVVRLTEILDVLEQKETKE